MGIGLVTGFRRPTKRRYWRKEARKVRVGRGVEENVGIGRRRAAVVDVGRSHVYLFTLAPDQTKSRDLYFVQKLLNL
ncbi:hypothetical protein MLD38_033109 [Melastoma candidum]|uniref:Uncharacterized protein n=1 Tax=Melastoma candidum TaxID=119954 RepID=A0ACB9M5P5_9MYRT|nr:hypothetical protein MLD38_033109 [Melastoma candidum]